LIEIDRLHQDGERAGICYLVRMTGDQDHARVRIFRNDITAGGRAIEFRHLVIHQDDVGMVAPICLDRF